MLSKGAPVVYAIEGVLLTRPFSVIHSLTKFDCNCVGIYKGQRASRNQESIPLDKI